MEFTFEEVNRNIIDNKEFIDSLCPSYPIYVNLTTMLDYIRLAIESPEGTEPEPLAEGIDGGVNSALIFLTEAVIDLGFSEGERQLLNDIINVFINFHNIYPDSIEHFFLVKILSLLVATSKTLEDSIVLSTYLFTRLRAYFGNEGTATQLSEKYFNEYQNFLKTGTNYSIR